jgi:hypothetical protein
VQVVEKKFLIEDQSNDKDQDDSDGGKKPSRGFSAVEKILMIFADPECKQNLKVINREVNMAMPSVTKYFDWPRHPSPSINHITLPTY